jgi:hypothetical protein
MENIYLTEDLDTLPPILKALILLLKGSPEMTVDDISNLKFGDFVNSIEHYLIYDEICPYDTFELGNILSWSKDVEGMWDIDDSRCITSSSASIYAILDYLQSERDQCIPFDEPLFTSEDGGKLTRNHILEITLQELKKLPQGGTE